MKQENNSENKNESSVPSFPVYQTQYQQKIADLVTNLKSIKVDVEVLLIKVNKRIEEAEHL